MSTQPGVRAAVGLRFSATAAVLAGVLASACSREAAGPSPPDGRHIDREKAFSYALPPRWTASALPQFNHDVVLLPKTDDRNRNVIINDQPGTQSIAQLKENYERDLPRSFKDFQLVTSEMVSLGGREVAKIVHLNTAPGVPVRQLNYILELGARRYFIACTVMRDDGSAFDAAFDQFVASFRPAGEP